MSCFTGPLSDISASPPASPRLCATHIPFSVPASPVSESPSCIFGSDVTTASEPDSVQQPGTTKRGRRQEWSAEKRAQEKERQKARKQKMKVEGTYVRKKKTPEQKAKKKANKRARTAVEKAERATLEGSTTPADYSLPKKAFKKYGKPETIDVTYAMEGASAAKGAYVGKNRPIDVKSGQDRYTVEGEREKGRRYIKWDGRCVQTVMSFELLLTLCS